METMGSRGVVPVLLLLLGVGGSLVSRARAQAAAGFGWKRGGEPLVDVEEQDLMRRMGYSTRMRNLYLGRPEERDDFSWNPARDERPAPREDSFTGRALGSVGRRRFDLPLGEREEDLPPAPWMQAPPAAGGEGTEDASEFLGDGYPEADLEVPRVPLSPEQFESQTQDLLDAVERFGEEAPATSPEDIGLPEGEDFEIRGEALAPDLLEAPAEFQDDDLVAFLGETGLDGSAVLEQSVTVGTLGNTYRSVADGRTTTDSVYVKHLAEWRRGFGTRNDLTLVNQLTLDSLRRGDILDATFSRQVEEYGALDVQGTLTIHQREEGKGEAEPDYVTGEFALSGRSDPLDGIGWDVRFYARDQEYGEDDPFYLDNESTSLQGGLRWSDDGFDLEGRHTLERDRYALAPLNDVDRILSEFTSYGALGGFDLSYYSQYQREGVKHVGELDAYRLWFNESTITRALGRRLSLEYRFTRQSRSVDQPSEFLYDSRETGRRVRAVAGFSPVLDGSLGFSDYFVRNRPGAAAVDETEDDRELSDVELYLHYAAGRLDAAFTGYKGRTRYLNGQSESFANADRSGLSVVMGYVFSQAWRADLTYSLDTEEYPTFPINDNQAESLGVSGSVSF